MLGKRLAELRKARKLTQADLSKMLGIHRGTYANYEAGKREPDNETLQKLADFFEVTTDWLLGRSKGYVITPSKETPFIYDITPADNILIHEKSRDELLQEITDDPDDYFFLDGYLDATEEEKKELRRYYFELKKKMRENNIKPTEPPSLFDITEEISKGPKKD